MERIVNPDDYRNGQQLQVSVIEVTDKLPAGRAMVALPVVRVQEVGPRNAYREYVWDGGNTWVRWDLTTTTNAYTGDEEEEFEEVGTVQTATLARKLPKGQRPELKAVLA